MTSAQEGRTLYYEVYIGDSFREERVFVHDSIFNLNSIVEMLSSKGIRIIRIRKILQVPFHDVELEEMVKKGHDFKVKT